MFPYNIDKTSSDYKKMVCLNKVNKSITAFSKISDEMIKLIITIPCIFPS